MNDLPKTVQEARDAGALRYFTGKPCIRQHIDVRATSTGQCMACQRGTSKARYRKASRREGVEFYVERMICRIRNSERNRGYFSDVTAEWLTEQIRSAVERGAVKLELNSPWAPSADQLSPGKGYFQDNVQIVPLWFNYAKHDFNEAELRDAIRTWVVVERRAARR